jgi:hypothetical protein
MKHFLLLGLLSAASLTSCQTTGDPSQGGLFGWSQGQADERIYARERYLNDVENDTAYQRRRSRVLEDEAARKQRQLDQQ